MMRLASSGDLPNLARLYDELVLCLHAYSHPHFQTAVIRNYAHLKGTLEIA